MINEPINVNEELKAKRNSLRYIFEKEITDENIRRFIFGTDGYSENAIRKTNVFPQYFNNILTLAFYFVYACYRCDLDNGYGVIDDLTSHNAKRIKKSLEKALVRYPITTDLMQFVLTDIQFELALGDDSELKPMFKNLLENTSCFNFVPYFELVNEYLQSSSRFKSSKLTLSSMFLDLVSNLSFLKNYMLVSEGPDSFRFITKKYAEKKEFGILQSEAEKYDDLPIEHLLYCHKKYGNRIFRIFSIEPGEKLINGVRKVALNLRYLTPESENSIIFSLPSENDNVEDHFSGRRPEEVFEETVGAEMITDKAKRTENINSNTIDQVHAVNYKYIKNLALAISDAISGNEGSRDSIYKRFSSAYPYIFEKYHFDNSCLELDWDSIIIMLLIEASPTVVLEHIIRNNRQMFYSIGKNLYKRIFEENLSVFNKKQDELKQIVYELINDKFILGESGGFGKLSSTKDYSKLFPRAAAMLILAKLNDWQTADVEDSLIYTGNLRDNISLLQNVSKDGDPEKAVKYACIILGETVKHTICFYAGLFGYGLQQSNMDTLPKNSTLSKKELANRQKILANAFMSAAKQQAHSLPFELTIDPKTTLILLDIFIDFCKGCTLSNGKSISTNSKNLHSASGKYEIIDLRHFEVLVNLLKESAGKDDSAIADAWVNTTLEILEYFKTGTTRGSAMDGDFFNAVYPFTATYNRGKENLDGYRTINFSLNIDADDDSKNYNQNMEVNVLSEFEYDRCEVYYCFPHVLRSNNNWWIDPILINFRDFNNIFTDLRKDED